MYRFIRRLGIIILTLVLVSFSVFLLQSLSPGDSSAYLLAEEAGEEERAGYRESMGLDDPFLLRYASFLSAIDAGAAEVDIGSMAAKDPEAVKALAAKFPSRVILSADARDGRIAVSGWTEDTGADAVSFIGDFLASGIGKAVVTDISRDGMLSGPSLELYRTILEKLPGLSLIASGGVSSLDDLKALAGIGCSGAIVGKAYYEGRISIEEMKEAECWRRG